MQKLYLLLRTVEHIDWVIYCVVGISLAYIIIFRTLHRDVSLIGFIRQSYEDSSNLFPSWVFSTLLFSTSFSVLFSQYVPVVPDFVREKLSFLGLEFNKMGYMLTVLLLFYLIKTIIVYLFFGSIHHLKKWTKYYFVAQKYYIIYSIVLIIIIIVHYYWGIDKALAFNFYFGMVIVAFLLKILIYLLNNQQILPVEWYYKFLYICTLQILPALVVWKLLFL